MKLSFIYGVKRKKKRFKGKMGGLVVIIHAIVVS